MTASTVHLQRFEPPSRAPDARPLVLLHGWGLNGRVFDTLAAGLATRSDVYAADLPGHGSSSFMPWDDYCTRLLAALPARFDLLGWSLGGQLALELARLSPQRVARLVLITTTPKFVASAEWPHGMRPEVLARFAAHLEQDYRRTVTEFLELQVRGSQDADATRHSLRAALLAHGEARPAALAAGLEWLRTQDLRDSSRLLPQPTLAIAGQYDRVTLPAAMRALAAAMPHAQAVELRRAGHAPFLSHPAETLTTIQHWLDSVPAP
jgi:pimeloyl-[acyl-carrier protein] methyl ester esterase